MSDEQGNTPAKPRKRILKHVHYKTATGIRFMLCGSDALKATEQEKIGMAERLTQLTQETGIDASKLTPHEAYLAAIRALLDKGEGERSELVEAIQRAGLDFKHRLYEAWGERNKRRSAAKWEIKEQTAAAPKRQKRERKTLILDHPSWGKNGDGKTKLQEGDVIGVKEASVDELRIGDLLILQHRERGSYHEATLAKINEDEIEVERNGDTFTHKLDEIVIWRVRSIRHTTIIKRPSDAPDAKSEAEKKINKLRSRLDTLGDHATDSTERFKIEREIYELEREANADEWPDIIAA